MNPYYVVLSLWGALFVFIITKEIYAIRIRPTRKLVFFITITLCWVLLLFLGGMENQNRVVYAFFLILFCCFVFLRLCVFCSAITAIIVLVLTGVAEIIAFIILHFFIGHSKDTILNNVFINLQLHLIILFFVILASMAIRKIIPNKLKCRESHPGYTLFILFFIFTLLLIYVNIYHVYYLSVKTKEVLYGVAFFLCLIFNFAFLYIYYQYKIKSKENKELKIYIKTAAQLTEELRNFKHNYFNLLCGFAAHIENNEITKLKECFGDIIAQAKEIDKNNLSSLQKIKNLSVVGLLAAKIRKAQDMGINFWVDISENEESLIINNYDFLEILGIYLDNAIEAASENEKGCVAFGFGKIDNNTHIIVKNTHSGQLPFLSSFPEKGFSTKGEGRGYGLWIVSEILKKYPEVLYSSNIKGNYFIQELIVPVTKRHF